MRKMAIVLIAFIIVIAQTGPVQAGNTLRVFYAGEDGAVKTAIGLAPAGTFTLVNDPAQADVFVLNGAAPQTEQIAARIKAGAGLVFIPGAQTDSSTATQLLGIPVTLTSKDSPISLTEVKLDEALLKEVIWNGAPQVRERVEMVTSLSSVQPLVSAYEDARVPPGLAWGKMLTRLHTFTDQILVDLLETYQAFEDSRA